MYWAITMVVTIMDRPSTDVTLIDAPAIDTRLKCFLPSIGTQTPAITGLKTVESKFRSRSAQVISFRSREFKKFLSNLRTKHMPSQILWSGVAATVSEKPRHGCGGTWFQWFAQYVASDFFVFLIGHIESNR